MSDTPLVGPVPSPDLHVMSFNIRRRMPSRMPSLMSRSADRWDGREPLVERLLQAEQPTVVGVQEALGDQAGFVRHALGKRYRSVGHGRQANRRGEGCPLYYDADRLELLAWNQTALSDTPLVDGSTSWGNMTPRIVVVASFRDLATGGKFRAINTHFDHLSRKARLRSADAILDLVAASPLPTFVTGDFNCDVGSRPHERITATGALVDSWRAARRKLSTQWGTFPNYRAPKRDNKRIDWILATPTIEVVSAAINTTRYDGAWPSDHTPVQAVLRMPG